jgi:hypothetical protein
LLVCQRRFFADVMKFNPLILSLISLVLIFVIEKVLADGLFIEIE